jgi:hypothetical protein
MGEMVFQARVRRRARALWLGLTLSAIVAQLGHAQSFSGATGQSNLTGLPGQNVAQQMMAQSINNFCPSVNTIANSPAATPGQKALAGLCGTMIGNALNVLGQPNPPRREWVPVRVAILWP